VSEIRSTRLSGPQEKACVRIIWTTKIIPFKILTYDGGPLEGHLECGVPNIVSYNFGASKYITRPSFCPTFIPLPIDGIFF
jgi:hypothetical protein